MSLLNGLEYREYRVLSVPSCRENISSCSLRGLFHTLGNTMDIALKILLVCTFAYLGAKASAVSPCSVKKAGEVHKPLFSGCAIYAECSRQERNLTEVPSLPSNVTCLELVKNKVSEIKQSDFKGLKHLKGITLSRNKITEIKRGVFKGLKVLNVLMLNGNKITSLKSGAFKGLKALIHLDLSNNRITDLNPGVFEGLNVLQWINLDGNGIVKLKPGVFGGLNLLRYLSLSSNKITELESGVFEGLLILKTVKLGGNSLKCNCITARTYELLMKTRSSLKISGKCDRSTRLYDLEAESICSRCGIPPLAHGQSCQNTVPGETNALKGEFPWHALLELHNSKSGQSGACGATLVKNNCLLTAAHCVYTNGKLRRPEDIQVFLGLHDRSKTNESQVQQMKVSRILPHPNYNAVESENNLALLKLSSQANTTDYVLPICLPRSSRRAKLVSNSSLGRVAGWRATQTCNPTGILQKACIRPITRKECNAVAHQTVPSSMMCTREDGEKTTNTGDVGGGLAFFELTSRRWVLGGVVSGELNVCLGCPRTALYMRITGSVLRWIEQV